MAASVERTSGAAPGGDAFPTTLWSRVMGRSGDLVQGPDWEALARMYWPPVAAWLRMHFHMKADDAADATQDFFAFLLEKDVVEAADPARGSFRAYLKTTLRRFTIDRHRKNSSQRVGGRMPRESLDISPGSILVDPRAKTPDEALDLAFRRSAISQAYASLVEELNSTGQDRIAQIFAEYYLDRRDGTDHAELARRHGLSIAMIGNHLKHARSRFKIHARRVLRETMGDDSDLDAEYLALFGER